MFGPGFRLFRVGVSVAKLDPPQPFYTDSDEDEEDVDLDTIL